MLLWKEDEAEQEDEVGSDLRGVLLLANQKLDGEEPLFLRANLS